MATAAKKSQVIRLSVKSTPEVSRLDQWICDQRSELSRSLIRKVIDLGGVHVNGRRVRKCSLSLNSGDQVEIYQDQGSLVPFRLTEQHLVYRDRYLLAINKPSGIESQPTPARYKGTLYEALLVYLKDPYRPLDKPEVGMVQRLDRETSGLMLFSTHPRSHKPLTQMFQARHVVKRYLALVHGVVAEDDGEYCSLLARQRRDNCMKSVDKGGKQAVTRYRVLQRFAEQTLVEVEIPTGRMHQIRVHFSEAGHPLAGDRRYGGGDRVAGYLVGRTMLHSFSILCDHPVTGQALSLVAPLADDFRKLLLALGWDAHVELSTD